MLAVQTVTGTGNVVTGNQARPPMPVTIQDMVPARRIWPHSASCPLTCKISDLQVPGQSGSGNGNFNAMGGGNGNNNTNNVQVRPGGSSSTAHL